MKNAELNRMTKAALINECDHDVEQEHDPRAPWQATWVAKDGSGASYNAMPARSIVVGA